MDPNETLRRLREAFKRMDAADVTDHDTHGVAAEEACEAFEALDDWLCKGGFKPKDWTAPRPKGKVVTR